MPDVIAKDNVRQKRLDGVSEAHEALPDIRVGLNANFLRMQERPPILRREDRVHDSVRKRLGHPIS